METQTPTGSAQAALDALTERAKRGEVVTAAELRDARAALELETFVAEAQERAQVEQRAQERAAQIAEIDALVERFEQAAPLEIETLRARLRDDLRAFAQGCATYSDLRAELRDAVGAVAPVQGDDTLGAVAARAEALPRARPQSWVFVAARDALKEFFPRAVVVELAEYSD